GTSGTPPFPPYGAHYVRTSWPRRPGTIRAEDTSNVRILLLLNGSRERYAGGADVARQRAWNAYCSPGTHLEVGYLPGASETGGLSRAYAFGAGNAMTLAPLYPGRCVQ